MLYGLWADSVDAMNDAIRDEARRADANYNSLQEWKAYAKQLEKKLEEVVGKYRETQEMYYSMTGSAYGQDALKNAALEELKKFDPTNKMFDESHRKAIFDKVKADKIADLTKK